MVSNYKDRVRTNADLKIEDTKEDLIALLRGEGGGSDLHRAPVALLDQLWVAEREKIAAEIAGANCADAAAGPQAKKKDRADPMDDDGYGTD